jgi:hypothetical protein
MGLEPTTATLATWRRRTQETSRTTTCAINLRRLHAPYRPIPTWPASSRRGRTCPKRSAARCLPRSAVRTVDPAGCWILRRAARIPSSRSEAYRAAGRDTTQRNAFAVDRGPAGQGRSAKGQCGGIVPGRAGSALGETALKSRRKDCPWTRGRLPASHFHEARGAPPIPYPFPPSFRFPTTEGGRDGPEVGTAAEGRRMKTLRLGGSAQRDEDRPEIAYLPTKDTIPTR